MLTHRPTRPPAHPAAGAPLRTLATLLCAVLCALAAVLGTAAPASAHAVQTGSTPTEGTVVKSAPSEVAVTYSEEVSMSDGSIRVLGPDGKRVDRNKVRVVGGGKVERAVGLRPDLPKGTYTVAWRAVSADSHPVAGAFTFSVGAPSATKADVGQGEDSGTRPIDVAYQTGRYAAYTGFVLLVGGAGYVLACRPGGGAVRRLQRLVVTGWLTLTAATLLMLLLRNSYVGTGSWGEILDLGGLKSVFGTKPGAALAARLLLLGTSAVLIAVLFGSGRPGAGESPPPGEDPAREQRDAVDGATDGSTGASPEAVPVEASPGLRAGGGAVAVGLAATWAMAEHASAGIQTEVAMPVDVLHMLAMAGWLGGLAALLVCLRRGPQPSRDTVRRFSNIAFGSVLTLVATGVYQSWRQLGSWSALTGTPYGQLLLAKLALVVLLVGAAWVSRRLVARLGEVREADEPPVREPEPAAVGAGGAGTATRDEQHNETAEVRTGQGAGPSTGTSAGPGAGPSAGTSAGPDAERAAQLARQRAAVEAARRRKARDADPERAALRRTVLAEAGIAVVLLAVTTGLTSTEPGRTEELARAGGAAAAEEAEKKLGPVREKIPFDTGGPGGKGTAELWITPGQAGGNSLRVMLKDPRGRRLDAAEVKAALRLPLQDLGPISVPFEKIQGNASRWRSEVVQLPLAGRWKVAVTVRTSEIDQVTETRTVRID